MLPACRLQLLVLVIAYAALGQFERFQPPDIAAHAGLVQNLFGGGPLLNAVYWSMLVERDFYIVLPLLALAWSLSYRLLANQSWFDPSSRAGSAIQASTNRRRDWISSPTAFSPRGYW